MYVIEPSALGQIAQRIVRDDPRFAEMIALEHEGTLLLFQIFRPEDKESWESGHLAWARIAPIDGRHYRLSSRSFSGDWQELDVEGDVERCVLALVNNHYHLFF